MRKIEGAEILLAFETNFFRQELHKWCPVAPEPPPLIEDSKSTRKPRPTKLQKLLNEYGVKDPDELPESVKGKANSLKRKALNAEAAEAAAAATRTSGGGHSATSPGAHGYGSGTFFGRSSSSQPQTPGLSVASSSHAHPSRGPDSSSSHHDRARGRSDSGSGTAVKAEPMDVDSASAVSMHPGLFMQTGPGVGPQVMVDPSLSLEERLLQGNFDDSTLESDLEKDKFLEILGQSEVGRRRAEEIFGRDVWSKGIASSGLGPNQTQQEDEGEVDRMFTDLVNQDEDEDAGSGGRKERNGENMTAADLESERNGMDALLDGD